MLRVFFSLLFFHWYYPTYAVPVNLEAGNDVCFEEKCKSSNSLYNDLVSGLSEFANKISGKKCGVINSQKLNDGFKKIFKIYNQKELIPSLSNFKIQEKTKDQNQENMLFNALARAHAIELKCASQYIKSVSKTEDSVLKKTIFSRLGILRQAQQRLSVAARKLMEPQNMNKICPIDLQQLEKERSYNLPSNYKICKEIIISRTAYYTTLNSIPFINTPSMKKFISQEAIRIKNDHGEDYLYSYGFRQTLSAVSKELEASSLLLVESINNKNSLTNRSLRHYLLGNPVINEKLAKDSQTSVSFKNLTCRANARYREGTEKLENMLLIGSFALGGFVGIGARSLSAASSIYKAGAIVRASTFSAKALQVSALATTGASSYAQISRKCSGVEKSELEVSGFSSGGKCTEKSLNIKKAEYDSCLLAVALNLTGFKLGTTNKFFKSSSKKITEVNKTIHDQIQNKLRDSFKVLINPTAGINYLISAPRLIVSQVKAGFKKGDISQIWRVPIKITKEGSGTISAMALISYINGKISINQFDYDNKETKGFRDRLGKEIYVFADLVSEDDHLSEVPEYDFKNDFKKQPKTHYIRASSYQELKEKLAKIRKENGLIYGLKIYGHGSPGSISIGDSKVRSYDLDMYESLKNVFKPGAKILLDSCSTGGGKKGILFTKKLGENLLDRGGYIYSSTIPIRSTLLDKYLEKHISSGTEFLGDLLPLSVAFNIFVNSLDDAPLLPSNRSRSIQIAPKPRKQ